MTHFSKASMNSAAIYGSINCLRDLVKLRKSIDRAWHVCYAQLVDLRCCWIQYESLNSAPINGYYGEWPIPVKHLWIAQLYMDPLFGCAIWSNCANSPIARDIYTLGRVTFSTFFETLLWVVWNWMGMIKDSICQKFEVLNH